MWAKVVNDEIMQLHDEDPSGLWHPDALEFWKEVPDNVHIGWKFKNGEWISGGQWYEEWVAENPPPPPGPPSGTMLWEDTGSTFEEKKFKFTAVTAGHVDECKWAIDGQEYTGEEVEVSFVCGDSSKDVTVELTVVGPGGNSEPAVKEFVIPALFVPPRAGTMEKDR